MNKVRRAVILSRFLRFEGRCGVLLRFTNIIVALGFSFAFSILVAAQDNFGFVNNITAVPVPGVGHDYIQDLDDIVNPANGSLSIRIEAPRPKERGLNYPFYAFMYDSTQQFALQYNQQTSGGPYNCGEDTAGDSTAGEGPQPLNCVVAVSFPYQSISWPAGINGVLSGPNSMLSSDVEYSRWVGGANYANCNLTQGYSYEDSNGVIHDLGAYQEVTNGSNACSYLGIQSNFIGGDEHFKIVLPDIDTNLSNGHMIDTHGNSVQVPGQGAVPSLTLEDTNGNFVNGTGRSGTYQSFQPWGDALAYPKTASRTFAGGATYNYSWGTATTHFTPSSVDLTQLQIGYDYLCLAPSLGSGGSTTNPVVVQMLEPDGLYYTFSYDPTYGLLNKITYPTGAWIQYTWGVNSLSDATGYTTPAKGVNSYNDPIKLFSGTTMNTSCMFMHDTPAIKKRVVSYDGVNAAQEQDFSYSTTWQAGNTGFWTSKQTTVATIDLLSPGTPSFKTIYNYSPFIPFNAIGSHLLSSPTPIENTINYYDTAGNVLRTVTKNWNSPVSNNQLVGECVTLPNGLTSGTFYQYQPYPLAVDGGMANPAALTTDVRTDVAEYDYGLVTSPCQRPTTSATRETVTTYATFGNTPLWPTFVLYNGNQNEQVSMPPMVDRPATVIVYQNGTRIAETDYNYDQTAAASVSPSPFGHDETNYGNNSSAVPRGNPTTVAEKCFQGSSTCADLITNIAYDTTGQPISVTDPNHNQTTLSYADSYTSDDGYPSGNTNTYVSSIARPSTNGVAHVESFQWDFNKGQLRTLTDENNNPTHYQYADPWWRLTNASFPDGGSTTKYYQDAGPNPTVITSTPINSSTTLTSTTVMDGFGHVTQTQLNSDPEGTTYTATTYDGLGRPYKVYNATRCNPPTMSCGEPTWGYTTHQYDPLGRTTVVTKQDGNNVQTDYSAFPMVKVTDETGRQRQSITDALGRLIEVDEPRAAGDPVVNYDVMQADGNFVVYAQGGVPEWSSGTWQTSSGGSYILDMQNDGNLVLYKTYSLWGSNTVQAAQGAPYATPGCTNLGATLSQNQTLPVGSCLVSPAGRYELVMQGDGNLVLYDLSRSPITSLWSSVTAGTGASYAIMQTDGNFVLYKQGGIPVPWSTNTWQSSPQGSFSIVMQDDGNLVVYNTYSLWDSNTVQSGGSAGPYPTPSCSNIGWQLPEGQILNMNSCLVSTSGRYELVLQSDGNLVLYDLSTGVALWNSGTQEFTPFTYPYITRYSYDALGNLLCVEQHGDEGGPGCSGSPSQDASSGWRVRRFSYDSLSRLLSSSNPESGSITYSYAVDSICNPGGEELLTKTDARGITSTYCYDALHRVLQRTYSDNSPKDWFQYDLSGLWGATQTNPIGRLSIEGSGSTAQTVFSYDAIGRVNGELYCTPSNCGTGGYTLAAVHDLAGNLTHLTYPDGRIVDYQIDGAGRTYNVASSGNTFLNVSSFWPGGQWQNATYGNGASTADTYNKRLQPSELKLMNGGNTPVVDLNYSWSGCDGSTGNNGNLCGISDAVNSNHNQTYSYDLLNRLSTASEADGAFNQTFSYDPWGNMSYSGGTGGSTSYSLQNRVAVYCHDQSGNILDYGACPATGPHQFAWNGAGRLSAVTAPNPASYTYDGDGNRVRKDAGSSWTEYIHFNGEPVAENSATGWTDYVFAGGKRIAEISAGNTQYYWADHLQSARVMLDSSGNAQCYDTYTPFGSEVGTCAMTHYKFTGKERDTESNLDYFGARYYSSTMGRWMSPDWADKPEAVPYADLSDPQSLNLYGYVRNNPMSKADADGHCGEAITCSVEFGATVGTFVEPGGGTAVGATVGLVVGVVVDVGAGAYLLYKHFTNDNKADLQPGSSGGPTAGKKFTPEERSEDAGKNCVYCGRPTTEEPGQENSRETDHADARSRDGNTDPANRNPACRTCNRQKGNKSVDEFREWQKQNPDKVPKPVPAPKPPDPPPPPPKPQTGT